jgi:23S rRNA pseudouridine1911/1915/1917 synthase
MNTNTYTVEQPARLDAALAALHTTQSRAILQRAIAAGNVQVKNTVITKASSKVEAGDIIILTIPEAQALPAEKGELAILHEDDDIIVINKPVGLVVHPTAHRREHTLVNFLLAHYPAITSAVLEPGNPVSEERPGIVHRLDRETSGLMVVAKNRDSLLNLQEQFANRSVEKQYQTILHGTISEITDVQAPIQRRGSNSANRMVASHKGEGRPAHTVFTPIETSAPHQPWPNDLATLVHVNLHTGRTHQIRTHAKFIGHPVLGDPLYFNKPSAKLSHALNLKHQVLESRLLRFRHPKTGEELCFTLPQYSLLEFLQRSSAA